MQFTFEPASQSPFYGHPSHHHHHHDRRSPPLDITGLRGIPAHPRHGHRGHHGGPRGGHGHPHDHHDRPRQSPGPFGFASPRPQSTAPDYDAQERQLLAQLEALRAQKAQAAQEQQAHALRVTNAREEQQRAFAQLLAQRSQQQEQAQYQRDQAYRRAATIRALEQAKREAVLIEAQRERERYNAIVQAQREQAFARQMQQRERQEREREQHGMRDQEKAFWQLLESCGASAQPVRSQPQPRQPPVQAAPAQSRTVQTPTRHFEPQAIQHQLPMDLLQSLFGSFAILPQSEQESTEPKVPVAQPTKPATQDKGKGKEQIPTPSAPAPAPKVEERQQPEQEQELDMAQRFIDDLFGAFSHAYDEKTNTKASVPAVPQPQQVPTPRSESTSQPTATPAAEAPAAEAPAAEEEEDIPQSAADLEASRSQATADLIQAKYRDHLLRVTRLEKLESLENKLKALDSDWTFPEHLDFLPNVEKTKSALPILEDPVDSASSNSESLIVPPLAFTPANVPYHAHAQALLGLLVQADSISSDGDEQVRNARREFVRLVEGRLGEMEVGRRRVWERENGKQQTEKEEPIAEKSDAVKEESTEKSEATKEESTDRSDAAAKAEASESTEPSSTSELEPKVESDQPQVETFQPEPLALPTSSDLTPQDPESTGTDSATKDLEPTEKAPAVTLSDDLESKGFAEGEGQREEKKKDVKEQVDDFVVL